MDILSEKEKLILESCLGCSSSLFSTNIYRKNIKFTKTEIYKQRLLCIKINKISLSCNKIMFISYQNNSGATHCTNVNDKILEEPFIVNNFNCSDDLCLYLFVFENENVCLFKLKCFPCLMIKETQLILEKQDWFFKTECESVSLEMEVYNLKKFHLLKDIPYEKKKESKKIIYVYNKKEICTNFECLFCFYKFGEVIELVIHLFMSHLHFNFTIVNEVCEIFNDKELRESKESKSRKHQAKRMNLSDSNSSKLYFKSNTLKPRLTLLQNDLEKSKEIKIHLKEKKVCYTHQTNSYFFLKKKRELSSNEKEYTFSYEYYQEETLAHYSTPVQKSDWVKFFILNQLEEIIDLNEKQLHLINQWNLFIFHNRVNSSNVLQYITDFVYKEGASFEMFEFLTTLKKKCVISEDEVREIIRDYLI
ncbi:hypothetical protein TUBRATIS_18250 [Tubulinosema ratisbonensis]|uniref:C2H2-type domain-containing protein n=1 Tax=Tubulinosema ratisbonensis TaxID=291195 RepID=A0A437AKQ6_9MICR|nr:hypothetical protein TUBRATIS_18250 [Tubulinosema ratisbonensis]